MHSQLKNLYWLLVSLLIIVLDQYSKILVVKYLTFQEPVPIIPFFNFTLAYNTGAAFNFLGSAGGWQRWFFAAIALIVTLGCCSWLYRLPRQDKFTALAISLIIGGALGNLWDRLTLGYVRDFIDFYVNTWHFPIFNIADSAICVGVAILVILTIISPQVASTKSA